MVPIALHSWPQYVTSEFGSPSVVWFAPKFGPNSPGVAKGCRKLQCIAWNFIKSPSAYGERTQTSTRCSLVGAAVAGRAVPAVGGLFSWMGVSGTNPAAANSIQPRQVRPLHRKRKPMPARTASILVATLASIVQANVLSDACAEEHPVLPNSVTEIPDKGLQNCGFKSIELPEGLTSIGNCELTCFRLRAPHCPCSPAHISKPTSGVHSLWPQMPSIPVRA